MPIRNQIEAVTQTLNEQPTFIYGTVNEMSGITSTNLKLLLNILDRKLRLTSHI